MLTWEYPPVVVGGLGRHAHALATALAAAGHEVVVLARRPTGTDAVTHPTLDTVVEGVRVLAVAEDPAHLEFERDLVAWTLAHGPRAAAGRADPARRLAPRRRARPRLAGGAPGDRAGRRARRAARGDVPRHRGGPLRGLAVDAAVPAGALGGVVAGQPGRRADHLLGARCAPRWPSCSRWTRRGSRWRTTGSRRGSGTSAGRAWRRCGGATGRRCCSRSGGWSTRRGSRTSSRRSPGSAARIRAPGSLVAGTGTAAPMLVETARTHRVRRSVTFLGHLPDDELAATLAAADAVVLPSRYEPFGIVALEAAAAGAPLVASTAGGLARAGDRRRDGRVVPARRRGGAGRGGRAGARRPAGGGAAGARGAGAAGDRLRLVAHRRRRPRRCTRRRRGGRPAELGRPKIPTGNVFGRPEAAARVPLPPIESEQGAPCCDRGPRAAGVRRSGGFHHLGCGVGVLVGEVLDEIHTVLRDGVFTAAVYSSSSACKRRTVSSVMGELLSG